MHECSARNSRSAQSEAHNRPVEFAWLLHLKFKPLHHVTVQTLEEVTVGLVSERNQSWQLT